MFTINALQLGYELQEERGQLKRRSTLYLLDLATAARSAELNSEVKDLEINSILQYYAVSTINALRLRNAHKDTDKSV